jgi:hypothetical protein
MHVYVYIIHVLLTYIYTYKYYIYIYIYMYIYIIYTHTHTHTHKANTNISCHEQLKVTPHAEGERRERGGREAVREGWTKKKNPHIQQLNLHVACGRLWLISHPLPPPFLAPPFPPLFTPVWNSLIQVMARRSSFESWGTQLQARQN